MGILRKQWVYYGSNAACPQCIPLQLTGSSGAATCRSWLDYVGSQEVKIDWLFNWGLGLSKVADSRGAKRLGTPMAQGWSTDIIKWTRTSRLSVNDSLFSRGAGCRVWDRDRGHHLRPPRPARCEHIYKYRCIWIYIYMNIYTYIYTYWYIYIYTYISKYI
jgi:hypothetical protein